jgi:hypothetical protein
MTHFISKAPYANEYTFNPAPMVAGPPTHPYLSLVQLDPLMSHDDNHELMDAWDLVRLPGYAAAYKKSIVVLPTKQRAEAQTSGSGQSRAGSAWDQAWLASWCQQL